MLLNKLPGKNKAQQLVEFAFIVPVLLMILFVILEFGYALNLRNMLSEGAKASLMQANKLNNLTGTAADKKTALINAIQANMVTYLTKNAVPHPSNVTVDITTDANNISTAKITYSYKPIFILPFMSGMPNIPLQSSQVINNAILQPNNFSSGLTTAQLSSFFPTPAGALTSSNILGYDIRTASTAILVNWYDDDDITLAHIGDSAHYPIHARLYSWGGIDLLPANERINVRRATIEVRSPYYNNGEWFNTQIPYVWVVSALGYSQVLYTKYNTTVDLPGSGGANGWTLNVCDQPLHFWAPVSTGFTHPGYNCPLDWAGNTYEYLYKIYPLDFDSALLDHNKFMRTFGYPWCSRSGNPAGMPDCNADQSGTGTIQEYALKGLAREGVYCTGHGLNYQYNKLGNYENIQNLGGTALNALQHYTVQIKDNINHPFTVNILQPVVEQYYTSASVPADPVLLQNPEDTHTTNGNMTPFFTAFKWSFNLTGNGIYNSSGSPNIDITDVYLDNDGDGIPNAWDGDPQYFDANANGILDGLEQGPIVHNYAPDTIANPSQQDVTGYFFPVPGINQAINNGYYKGPVISTPFVIDGSQAYSRKIDSTYPILIPALWYSLFLLDGGRLYIPCANHGTYLTLLCRTYKTPSTADKQNYVNATNGILDSSLEMQYLNNYGAANLVTRTSGGW